MFRHKKRSKHGRPIIEDFESENVPGVKKSSPTTVTMKSKNKRHPLEEGEHEIEELDLEYVVCSFKCFAAIAHTGTFLVEVIHLCIKM